MRGVAKILLLSAPVAAALLVIYLVQQRIFLADYAAESVRFEREWRDFLGKPFPGDDPFLAEQLEEARRLRARARSAPRDLDELERTLREESDRISSPQGDHGSPNPDRDPDRNPPPPPRPERHPAQGW